MPDFLNITIAKERKTTVCLNPQIKKPGEFTTENMLQLQKYAGQSNSEMSKYVISLAFV